MFAVVSHDHAEGRKLVRRYRKTYSRNPEPERDRRRSPAAAPVTEQPSFGRSPASAAVRRVTHGSFGPLRETVPGMCVPTTPTPQAVDQSPLRQPRVSHRENLSGMIGRGPLPRDTVRVSWVRRPRTAGRVSEVPRTAEQITGVLVLVDDDPFGTVSTVGGPAAERRRARPTVCPTMAETREPRSRSFCDAALVVPTPRRWSRARRHAVGPPGQDCWHSHPPCSSRSVMECWVPQA